MELLESSCVRPRHADHPRKVSEKIKFNEKQSRCAYNCAGILSFPFIEGLASSEKQMPRFVGKIDS